MASVPCACAMEGCSLRDLPEDIQKNDCKGKCGKRVHGTCANVFLEIFGKIDKLHLPRLCSTDCVVSYYDVVIESTLDDVVREEAVRCKNQAVELGVAEPGAPKKRRKMAGDAVSERDGASANLVSDMMQMELRKILAPTLAVTRRPSSVR